MNQSINTSLNTLPLEKNNTTKENYQIRFWISVLLTLLVILLSPFSQRFLFFQKFSFFGITWIQLILGTVVLAVGGWPFIKECFLEIRTENPGIMTLSTLAVMSLYFYTATNIFTFSDLRFTKFCILIDIMLLYQAISSSLIKNMSRSTSVPLEYFNRSSLFGTQSQQLSNQISWIFTILTIDISVICLLVWNFFINTDLSFSLQRMITVLIIAAPNAITITVPLLLASSSMACTKNGILIKNQQAFENVRKIQTVFFDKTGTLTQGNFGVADIEVFKRGINRDELIKYAASVEMCSNHPLAKAIVQFSEQTFEATMFSDLSGKGVSALVEGRNVKVVNEYYLQEHYINVDTQHIKRLKDGGRSVLYILIDDKLYGAIVLCDIIRTESRTTVKTLKKMGIKTALITADNKHVAKFIAQELHLDNYYSEIPSFKKIEKLKELKKNGVVTAITANSSIDEPVFNQVDIGFALGTDADIKFDKADICLKNVSDIVKTIIISKMSFKKINQTLFLAVSYNIIAVLIGTGLLSFWGITPDPVSSAIISSLFSFLMVLNSRFLRF